MSPAKVRETRKILGMTQRELGERLGMTVQQISNYENGRSGVPRVVEMALMHLIGRESYNEDAFMEDWSGKEMEAYDAL